jgi:hypothetical protein
MRRVLPVGREREAMLEADRLVAACAARRPGRQAMRRQIFFFFWGGGYPQLKWHARLSHTRPRSVESIAGRGKKKKECDMA